MPSTTSAPSWAENGSAPAEDGLRARVRAAVREFRTSLSRTLRSLSDTIGSSAPLVKALLDLIGKDRGFGFYRLVAAIALAIGLLVALVLSPVVALLAALIAGIWILTKRARSAQSAEAAS